MELNVIEVNRSGRKAYSDKEGQVYLDCTNCKDIKPIDKFSKHKGLMGKRTHCNECMKIKKREYRRNNPEIIKAINKRSVQKLKSENPVAYKERERRYDKRQRLNKRARDKGMVASLTVKEIDAIFEMYEGNCALTGIPFPSIDHIIPIAVGGGSTFNNILPLASHLNSYKRDLNIFEWAEEYHEYLLFPLERFYEVMNEVAERNGMTLDEYKSHVYTSYATV